MKFSSHGTYIRPNNVVRYRQRAPAVFAREDELPQAQAEHKKDKEAGLEVIDPRRASRWSPNAGQV